MCLTVFGWQAHAAIDLLLLFNRDEFLSRPTSALHWWTEDRPHILAGRDELGRGTWLGTTRHGRVAFLTNFREPQHQRAGKAPSRGALVTGFLEGREAPLEYLRGIQLEAVNGFNLVVLDLGAREAAALSNRGPGAGAATALVPGWHSLSNGVLDEPWPKAVRAHEALHEQQPSLDTLSGLSDGERGRALGELLRAVLSDARKESDPARLPQTGMGHETEQLLSSIFIEPCTLKGEAYGTRSQTALLALRSGAVTVLERSSCNGRDWTTTQEHFTFESICKGKLVA